MKLGDGICDPRRNVGLQAESPFATQEGQFPNADGRQPQFILLVGERPGHAAGEAFRLHCAPEPNMCVQQIFHSRHAAQSWRLPVGPTISPRISAMPAMHPSFLPVDFGADGGTTSATGRPKRVTQIGLRVLRTSSRRPRHLALNSEMATSFMDYIVLWSMTMVNSKVDATWRSQLIFQQAERRCFVLAGRKGGV